MSDRIYLSNLLLENIRKFERFEAEFGPGLNVITGGNHEGKTTCIDTLRMFFEGGVDWTLLRNGQLTARAAIGWSDGLTAEKKLKRAAGPDEKDDYEVEVRGPSGEVKRRAAETISSRVHKGSFDPAAFLKADPRQRAAFLIQHLDLQFSAAEVNATLNSQVGKIPNSETLIPPLAGVIKLDKFGEIFDTVYEQRRLLNVEDRDLRGAMEDLQSSIPEGVDDEAQGLEEDIQRQLDAAKAFRSGIQSGLADKRSRERSSADAIAGGTIREIKDKAAAEIEAIRNRMHRDLEAVTEALDSEVKRIDDEHASQLTLQTIEVDARIAGLSGDLAEARAKAQQFHRAEGVRKAIQERKARAEGLSTRIARRSAVLEAMDRLKSERMRSLPIEGLDIAYDREKRPQIKINGVLIDSLSGQEALFLAFQCVLFAAGESPLVIAEGDGLDEKHMKLLGAHCMAADPPIQVILARHSEGDKISVQRFDTPEELA